MRIFVLTFISLSLPAFACPDLTGSYAKCVPQNNRFETANEVTLSQLETSSITHYKMKFVRDNGSRMVVDMIADGQPYTTTQVVRLPPARITTTTTSVCIGDVLRVDAVMLMNGKPMGHIVTDLRKEGDLLMQDISGNVLDQDFTETVICE
jgi:uncharacterized membrane protein